MVLAVGWANMCQLFVNFDISVVVQLYVKRDIQGYKPAPGDLAYPDKLIVASSISSSHDDGSQPTQSDSDSVFDNSSNEASIQ